MRNLLTIGLLFGLSTGIMAQGVFISEYIEGSSNNKALEIYNGGAAAVDLANYSFWRISNGGDWTEYSVDLMDYAAEIADMTLDPGETFVICNSSAIPEIQALSDYVGTGATYYNGDDATGLAVTDDGGTSWTLIDAVGEDGPDVGTAWDVAGVTNATTNHTLIRKNSVVEGNLDWPLSAGTTTEDSEWIVLGVDVYSGLGSHGEAIDTPPSITDLAHAPVEPAAGEAVVASATITDDSAVTDATLYYSVDGGIDLSVAMSIDVGDSWVGTIPAQIDGVTVSYYVEATDDATQTSTSSTIDYFVGDVAAVTIYDIQYTLDPSGDSPLNGSMATITGLVTALAPSGSGSFFLSEGSGAWQGIQVYGSNVGVAINDEVTVTGTVTEYYNFTEIIINSDADYTVNSSGNTPYAIPLLAMDVAYSEDYEGTVVRVEDATCSNIDLGNGEWEVTDGVNIAMVDDMIYGFAPTLNQCYHLQGIMYYSFSNFKIELRDASDISICGGGNLPPVIADLLHTPDMPTSSDAVVVSATVTDDNGLDSVVLSYSVDAGAATTVAMTIDAGDSYIGTIPAQADGSAVEYFVEATDDEFVVTTSATGSYSVVDAWDCTDLALVRVNDVDGNPDMMGQTVLACGTVTVALEFGTAGPAFMTGPTGSVAIYAGALIGSSLAIGDEIQVLGEVAGYNGLTQVLNSSMLTIVASPGPLAPVALTVADVNLAPESYEAQLVTFTGVELVNPLQWPAPGNNANVDIVQGTDAYTMRVDRDTDIDEGAAPVGLFNLTGVIGQYDADGVPYDTGYQIIPRTVADLAAGAGDLDAPVVSIEFDGNNVVLTWDAVVGATDYMVYTSGEGYDGFGVGASTGGLTTYTLPAAGVAFFKVGAVN
jgi:hypothetical protein